MSNKLTKKISQIFEKSTIRGKLFRTFSLLIIMVFILNFLTLSTLQHMSQCYDEVVARISEANRIVEIMVIDIPQTSFFLSSGRISHDSNELDFKFDEFKTSTLDLQTSTTDPKSKKNIKIILRTLNTLEKYIKQLNQEVSTKSATYDERKATVDNIRTVSDLINELTQNYISSEIASLSVLNNSIQQRVRFIRIFDTGFIICISFILVYVLRDINQSITNPIKTLVSASQEVASGNFSVSIQEGPANELQSLNRNFNIMTQQLEALVEQTRQDAENLMNFEMRLLQEQINPHFLFNTLETIIWSIEAEDTHESLELVQELSNFFRVTLSGGRSIIPLREEISHLKSYLVILEHRYQDILSYSIEVPDNLLDYNIPKLTLQPIVENAIYHGIKNKRSPGKVIVRIHQALEDDFLIITIIDDGVGMDAITLNKLQENLENYSQHTPLETGLGLPNIYRRIKLYYGESSSLKIESKLGTGTIVQIKIQANKDN